MNARTPGVAAATALARETAAACVPIRAATGLPQPLVDGRLGTLARRSE